ncbi:unnamed protein product [Adineta ricciae]|uniref:Uncharacterized protein n=1 Tax=Adineta ricciae TaxID=249248 RepID=A0A815L0E5_ADIRI|nr:unnamed protein product [Adineta ricciae]CAF1580787.1 unnamed protein product [Adineta ricciae]
MSEPTNTEILSLIGDLIPRPFDVQYPLASFIDGRNLHELGQLESEGCVCELDHSNLGKSPFSCDYSQGNLKIRGLHLSNNCNASHPME